MNVFFMVTGIVLIVIALVHAVVGGRHLVVPICETPFDMNLFSLIKSEKFAKQILRFAWQLTTVILITIGILLIYWSLAEISDVIRISAKIFAGLFLVSSIMSLVYTRGRHWISWVGFLAAAVVMLIGSL